MKFFNENVLTEDHVKMLLRSRLKYVTAKQIKHGENFIEAIKMEKPIRVKPKEDKVLELIKEKMIPLIGSPEYSYKKLPSIIKKEMYKLDSLYFAQWVKKLETRPDVNYYDIREERLRLVMPLYTEDDYIKYVLNSHPIPSTLGKKAKESARRAYKKVNGLLKSNVHILKNFVTLTIAPMEHKEKHLEKNRERNQGENEIEFEYIDAFDFEIVKEEFTEMINRLKMKYKKRSISFEYIAVWELQKSGAYHIHMLSTEIPIEEKYNIPEWLDYDHVKKKRNNGSGLIAWKFGKSDVQKITNLARLSTYVSKYIIKSFLNVNESTYEQYLNKKKYFRSYGLINSIEEYIDLDDFDEIVNKNNSCCDTPNINKILENVMDKNDRIIAVIEHSDCEKCGKKKSAYVKNYNNPYNLSEIEKRTYTLIDMESNDKKIDLYKDSTLDGF